MLKMLLLSTSLVLNACSSLPPFPEVEQSGYSIKFKKFRACNTVTHECRNIQRDDPSMEGAQCLNANDYKKSEAWIDTIIQEAQAHCH